MEYNQIMENFKDNQNQYGEMTRRAHEAVTEEEAISAACETIDFDIAMNRTPIVFIPDFTNEGHTSQNAIDQTAEIAKKIKVIYEEKGHNVKISRDIADFREFSFYVDSEVDPHDELV